MRFLVYRNYKRDAWYLHDTELDKMSGLFRDKSHILKKHWELMHDPEDVDYYVCHYCTTVEFEYNSMEELINKYVEICA